MKSNHPTDGAIFDPDDEDLSREDDFLGLFCGKFGCQPAKFEKFVFLECVYPEGRDAARVLRLLYPGFFRSDFVLIEAVSHATSLAEFKKLVDYHAAQTSHEGGLRALLKVRMSKQRLLKLAQTLFGRPVLPVE